MVNSFSSQCGMIIGYFMFLYFIKNISKNIIISKPKYYLKEQYKDQSGFLA